MINRQMRLMIFFDLPVKTEKDKKEYTKFRKFLLKNGFQMLQFSVYVRLTRNKDDLNKYIRRVENNLPKSGIIQCLELTEMQYARMHILLGEIQEENNEDFMEF